MRTPARCVQSFRNACDTLSVPGITERWNAVQQHLHPHLAALAHQIHMRATQHYPRHWPLYEVSYKSQRYINREATAVTGETLRNPFRLPLNISITGTVNVDESTYALSDKVLDRANVIELTDGDLAAFRATYPGPIDEDLWHIVCHIHAIVTDAGHPFGYRTLREMLHYIEHAHGTLSLSQALDLQIKQKILPKLRGEDSPPLRRALSNLETILETAQLSESAKKVHRMLERLNNDGFTDFYV